MNRYFKQFWRFGVLFLLFFCITSVKECKAQVAERDSSLIRNDSISLNTEWLFEGNFIVDSIYEKSGAMIYIIACVDSTDLQWGGIFNDRHDYRGILFTVVSFGDKETNGGEVIQKKKIYKLTLALPDGYWHLYYRHRIDGKSIEYQKVEGENGRFVYVSVDEIHTQLTVSKNIKGKYYVP